MMISKRTFLAGAVLTAFGPAFAKPPAKKTSRLALRQLADAKGLVIGSVISVQELNPTNRAFFLREVSAITPETEMKMTAIRPSQDEWSFARADAIVDFGTTEGLAVRGHTLIWNNDKQPAWLTGLSRPAMLDAMQEHIERVMSRYAGRVAIWDVINEPVGDVSYGRYQLRDGPFLASVGPEYIAYAFRIARSVDPKAKLVLIETHTERVDRFGLDYRTNLLYLIDRLQDAGVPLDGIGLQGHLEPNKPFDPDGFAQFLHNIERRKLFIDITEMDVKDDSFPDDEAKRDAGVAEAYRHFLDAALSNPAVRSVSFWQLSDKTSWYYAESVEKDPASKRRPRPLLFTEMRRKPAFTAVADALRKMPPRPNPA